MERRLTITYAVSAAATICTACVTIGAVFGSPFAQARPPVHSGIERIETVDDYVVVPSSTTAADAASTAVRDYAYIATRAAATAPAETSPATTTVATPAPAVQASNPVPTASSPTTSPPMSTPAAAPNSDDHYGAPEGDHSDEADHSDDGGHEEGDD